MIEFRVERAQSADWRRIRDARLRSLADAPDAFGTTLVEDEARPENEWRESVENEVVAHMLAIGRDHGCLGIAVGAPYTGFADAAGLFGMWVDPQARGLKVGTALVQAVVAWAREQKYRRIILDVGDANQAAIRLYESCGFVPTGKTSTLPPPRQHIAEHQRSLNLG